MTVSLNKFMDALLFLILANVTVPVSVVSEVFTEGKKNHKGNK
jgi:hypothetical protein